MRKEQVAYEAGYRVAEDGSLSSPHGPISGGYIYFRVGKRGPVVSVHRLAALQWFGERLYDDGMQVRHLNNNPSDNTRTNLALGTKSENEMDKLPETRLRAANAGAARVRKLSEEQVQNLRADHEAGLSYRMLMEKYGLAKSTVSYVVNHKTYTRP